MNEIEPRGPIDAARMKLHALRRQLTWVLLAPVVDIASALIGEQIRPARED
jgi:hypothetical protein